MATRTSSSSSFSSSSSPSSRTCLCSPTTHPGSFRCSRHRGSRKLSGKYSTVYMNPSKVDSKTHLIKWFLMQIIKPSSHDLQRRRNFQPRPTRFCLMNCNGRDGVAVS